MVNAKKLTTSGFKYEKKDCKASHGALRVGLDIYLTQTGRKGEIDTH